MTESGEQIRKNYRDKLGTEFGDVFHELRNAWAWSRMRCDEYYELFSRAEDVALLNALTGGAFTWDIQNILWEDLLLRVCRLTDSPQSLGKDNLTVRLLPTYCKKYCSKLHDQVEDLVEEAKRKSAFARDWRNRRIGHSDFERTLGRAKPLAPASLRSVTDALDAIHAVLHTISYSLLEEGISNEVSTKPRARAFLAYARQLVDAAHFIEAAIDPEGTSQTTDTGVAITFLE